MRVCPICEGYTSSDVPICGTCDVPLVAITEVAWARRDADSAAGSPWLGLVIGGKYRIKGILGKGGMGTVYRAIHELSLSPVALKILNPRFARVEGYRDTLLEEARKGSLVRSEHVSRVLDVGETPEGAVFIAMELVEGETLHEWLQREGSLSPGLVIELLRQLCSALEEAHARGIVHHDLTPRNIMVEATPSGFRAKVLDFGIARLAGQDPSETASEELSELWVNPPFTAPEVLSRQPADEASDFYSLGVVAYVALSGRLPHGGTTLKERVQQVIEEDPEPLKVQRGTPRRLIQLIGALTSKDPAGRPSSIAAVREELQRLQQPMGFLARAVCVLVFIAGFSLLMVQLAARPALYLKTSNRDPELTLSEAWPRSEIQVVRMEDLSSLELEAGGFSASELLVEISRPSQGSSRSVRLYGQLVDGYLSFDEKRDESWASFLEELGKELDEGPGDLSLLFRHSPAGEKGEPLAYARILVDREPPAIKVENLEPGNVLRIRTALRISVEDDVGTTGIEYWIKALDKENTILDKGRQEIAEKSFELEIGKLFTSEELQSFDGPLVFGCRAEDRAHRTTLESERIWFQRGADLFIPEIEQAGNRRFEPDLRIVKNQIEVALGLSAPEEKLRVHLRVKKNDEWVDVPDPGIETDGSTLRLSWDLPRGQADSALYEFQLEDRVGNLSLPKSFRFDFVNLDPRAKFNVVSGLARLLEDPPRLFIGREPVTIEYFCNEIFRPEAEIVNAGKLLVKFSSHEVSLGHCRLTLEPPSRAVSFQIKVLHIFEESTGARSELEYGKASLLEVSVLPDPPAIETVAELVGGRSWTPELIEKGVLHQELDGGDLSLGRGIKIHLAGEHAVAGALWVFRNGSWQEEKRVPDLKTALIRGEIPVDPQHGSNRYALEARDILGRHLVDRRAGSEPDEQGRIVFADFRHDETAPEPPEQIPVEHGHEVSFRLREDQPFVRGDPIELEYGDAGQPVQGTVQSVESGSLLFFRLTFGRVVARCNWTRASEEGFARRKAVALLCKITTPAGKFPIRLSFRPTRSLLASLHLGSLVGAGRGVPAWRKIRMVPFLGPDEDFPMGATRAAGSIRLERQIAVKGVEHYYLSENEISREAYAAFVGAVSSGRVDPASLASLWHAADPMKAARFSRAGLAPRTGIFGAMSLEDLALADPERPITGVNYYQASAFARWLGQELFGDPDTFRLPFGVELEWASLHRFGAEERRTRLNGMQTDMQFTGEGRVSENARKAFLGFRKLTPDGLHLDPESWPLSMVQQDRLGDWVAGFDGDKVFGLDFGVREWVEDLPVIPKERGTELILFWVRDHRTHAEKVEDLRQGRPWPDSIRAVSLRTQGVVRGLGFGEPEIGGRDPAEYLGGEALGDPALIGVRRAVHVPRDGSGLTRGQSHPLVPVLGFRIAGAGNFVRRAREAMR